MKHRRYDLGLLYHTICNSLLLQSAVSEFLLIYVIINKVAMRLDTSDNEFLLDVR